MFTPVCTAIMHLYIPHPLTIPFKVSEIFKFSTDVSCLIWYLKVKVQMPNKQLDFPWLYSLCSHTEENAMVVWHRRGLADGSLTRCTYNSSYPVIYAQFSPKPEPNRWNHITCSVPINPILILCVLKHFRSYYSMIICFCLDKSI